jgi:hypothetical protein
VAADLRPFVAQAFGWCSLSSCGFIFIPFDNLPFNYYYFLSDSPCISFLSLGLLT